MGVELTEVVSEGPEYIGLKTGLEVGKGVLEGVGKVTGKGVSCSIVRLVVGYSFILASLGYGNHTAAMFV